MMGSRSGLRKNEQGFAAILVTIVLLVVVSLITTGFAIQMRKEQQAALDNQLSAQAYYAAESGVNDYAKAIKTYITNNPAPTSVTDLNRYLGELNSPACTPPSNDVYSGMPSSTLTPDGGVKYTCVTVNASPTQLQYGSIGGSSQIIPIESTGTVNKLVLTWQPTATLSGTGRTASCPSGAGVDTFPATTSWNCPISIVRIDLVPTPLGSSYSLDGLQASTMTAFLVPTHQGSGSSGTVSYQGSAKNQYGNYANQGAVVGAKCSDNDGEPDPSCTMTITDLSPAGSDNHSFYLRISTIYGNAAVNIQGYTNSDLSNPLELSGAQVVVDSTGLAQDVLHRIQVRIPVGASAAGDTFNSAIMSAESLCKQFQTAPPNLYVSGPNGC